MKGPPNLYGYGKAPPSGEGAVPAGRALFGGGAAQSSETRCELQAIFMDSKLGRRHSSSPPPPPQNST